MISGRKLYPKAALPSASPSKEPARRVEDKHNDITNTDPVVSLRDQRNRCCLFDFHRLPSCGPLECSGTVCFRYYTHRPSLAIARTDSAFVAKDLLVFFRGIHFALLIRLSEREPLDTRSWGFYEIGRASCRERVEV